MILYRISNFADLAGLGGELADGRWHTREKGKRVVYTSDHPALCILEVLVHNFESKDEMPDTYQLLRIDVPDSLIESVDARIKVQAGVDTMPLTQEIGDRWLRAAQKGGLLVPSVLVPAAQNCILNSKLPEIASIRPEVIGRFPFDKRLLAGPTSQL